MAKKSNKANKMAAKNARRAAEAARKANVKVSPSTLYTGANFNPWVMGPMSADHPVMLAGLTAKTALSMQLREGITVDDLPTVKHIKKHWEITSDECKARDGEAAFNRITRRLFPKSAFRQLSVDLDAILDIVERDGFVIPNKAHNITDAFKLNEHDATIGFIATVIGMAMQFHFERGAKITR
jgi:hypothetical protein